MVDLRAKLDAKLKSKTDTVDDGSHSWTRGRLSVKETGQINEAFNQVGLLRLMTPFDHGSSFIGQCENA